jgi:hypothetical protein
MGFNSAFKGLRYNLIIFYFNHPFQALLSSLLLALKFYYFQALWSVYVQQILTLKSLHVTLIGYLRVSRDVLTGIISL